MIVGRMCDYGYTEHEVLARCLWREHVRVRQKDDEGQNMIFVYTFAAEDRPAPRPFRVPCPELSES